MPDLIPLTETNAYADPQAVFRLLRAQWGEVAPVELEPGINAWLVMGHEELVHVLRRERLFAKDAHHWRDYAEGRVPRKSRFGPLMFPRPNAFHCDGEAHRRMRLPIDDAVRGLRTRQASQQVREVCSALIGGFAPNGRADLIDEYALMIPAMAMGRLLGLTLRQSRDVHDTMQDLLGSGKREWTQSLQFVDIISGLVQERRTRPADDMTSVIAGHEYLRSDEERVNTVATMIVAAAELTMAWIGTSLRLLLTDDRFAGRLRGGRLGIDEALDEVLWRDPPLANLPARYALYDTQLGGQHIRRGDALILGFSAANADPRVHSDDRWSEVGNQAYLSWGAGPHTCPGQDPARIITRTAVVAALHELPGLRLAVPPGNLGWSAGPWTRCPAALPVTFSPRPPRQ